jgi:hypothetical protein
MDEVANKQDNTSNNKKDLRIVTEGNLKTETLPDKLLSPV